MYKRVINKDTFAMTGVSRKSVIQWYRYIHDVWSWKLLNIDFLFCWENNVVQIDEIKFMKFKKTEVRKEKIWWPGTSLDFMTKKLRRKCSNRPKSNTQIFVSINSIKNTPFKYDILRWISLIHLRLNHN